MDTLIILISLVILPFSFVFGKNVANIAIIGGGIGGCSSAYFLEELFGRENVQIDLYEPNTIGGRLAVENINGDDYEMGGSVIHPRNKYMVDFAQIFSLNKRNTEPSKFGLYDGKEFVFSEESNWEYLNTLRFLWRYGMDVFKLQHFIDSMLDSFERIYTLQSNHQTYSTVSDLLAAMSKDFVKGLSVSSKEGFKESGFSERIISELIAATLLVNFGQTTDVHKFVGAVSVAGGTNGLWAIEGGNRMAAKKVLESTNASYLKAKVDNITLNPNSGTFNVSYSYGESKTYDIVILALPMVKNTKPGIDFIHFPEVFSFHGEYHQTVSTLVSGDINSAYFGIEPGQLQEILLIKNNTFLRSIGIVHPVSYNKDTKEYSVWKVFSDQELTEEELRMLFIKSHEVRSRKWFAYPHYNTEKRVDKFILFNNLYHVNAIEWAASAMEMSVIGAKNVALLAFKNWHKGNMNHMKDEL